MSSRYFQSGQVTYPKMERQDLTQGQLGAFKFIPTDEARPGFVHRPAPGRPFQYASPQQHFDPSPHADFYPTKLSPHKAGVVFNGWDAALGYPQTSISPTRPNPTFFDEHFKPDLERSRLQLGPNALRAAVDGCALDPQNRYWDSYPSHEALYPTTMPIDNQETDVSRLSNNRSLGSPLSSFTPNASIADHAETSLFYRSLLRALAAEQDAHQTTKNLLEAEKTARKGAEEYMNKVLSEHSTLMATVQMLKSVVQHNLNKEDKRAEEAVIEVFHKAVESAPEEKTLLHDAVQNLRRPSKKLDPRVEEHKAVKLVPDSQLFNFDIPQSSEFDHLRRHFSDKVELVTDVLVGRDENKNQELIPISPQEKIPRGGKSDESWDSCEVTRCKFPDKEVDKDLVVVHKPKTKETSKLMMAMPYDVHIQWSREPIFEDEQDKIRHLGRHQSSMFFEHPVRYLPRKSDKNIYRTVMIDFIPVGATCKEVLDTIKGGELESIQIYGPLRKSTNFMTARIVFDYELPARGVYMRGQSPGVFIRGKRVRVWQVLEPTYPRNEDMEEKIFHKGYTRLLLIDNATKAALDELPTKLAHQAYAILDIRESLDEIPLIEFTGVAEASRALEQLMNDPDFSGSMFDFEDDPCNGTYRD